MYMIKSQLRLQRLWTITFRKLSLNIVEGRSTLNLGSIGRVFIIVVQISLPTSAKVISDRDSLGKR